MEFCMTPLNIRNLTVKAFITLIRFKLLITEIFLCYLMNLCLTTHYIIQNLLNVFPEY